jgi:hypothetical protein
MQITKIGGVSLLLVEAWKNDRTRLVSLNKLVKPGYERPLSDGAGHLAIKCFDRVAQEHSIAKDRETKTVSAQGYREYVPGMRFHGRGFEVIGQPIA